ncbi:hypothetical protein [Aurantiacibacter sp. MUD61]|uniref:hypothetical protein n=1 Tax=Aurantiacibacter sp. MUD61 TaxID=3009083 RepID=UPI0022EFFADD|nr:hypothetical protein [Aurantiacibacter sp. MUD61]
MRRLLALVALGLLAGCAHQASEPVEPIFLQDNGYAGDIYWASYQAAGYKQCDRELGEAAQREFDRYFRYRVERVREAYENRYGPSQEFIVTTDCRRWGGSNAAFFREKRELRREFALWLARVEAGIESWSDIP